MTGPKHVIAIVDDDAQMREALNALLTDIGFDTRLFASAEVFRTVAPILNATCVLVDFHIGDVLGVDLVRQLRAGGFTLPVIFITGSDDKAARAQAFRGRLHRLSGQADRR